VPPKQPTLERDRARLLSHATIEGTDCWEWQGALAQGYGSFYLRGRNTNASRAMWLLFCGPHDDFATIPHGMDVCHTCDNRRCINPAHLWLGTRRDNVQDARQKGRLRGGKKPVAQCKQGHRRNFDKYGNCRDCARAYDRARSPRRRKSAVRQLQRWLPQTPAMAQASEQDETIAAPLEDDAQEVGDEA
jgi:HNH endonuclease